METVAPFGSWPSPLDADAAAAGKVSLSEIASDGTSVFWLESRPRDGGRVVLVRADSADSADSADNAEHLQDHSGPGVSIRSRVHEYGGGAWCLVPSDSYGAGAFAYVDAADQRVWFQPGAGATPRALTPAAPAGERWAHGGLGASADGAWVVAVREVHDEGQTGVGTPRRCLVALATGPGPGSGGGESILAQGHGFYGAPRLDAATRRLAVVVWDHPDMPWDRSSVVVIPLEVTAGPDGSGGHLGAAGDPWTVEGGPDVSVGQAVWRRDGSLRFVSDRRGWWQPYVHCGWPDGPPAEALTTAAAEFHGPDWALGQSTMAEVADATVVARMTSAGRDSLVVLGEPERPPSVLAQPCVSVLSLCAHGGGVAYIGAPPDGPASVWMLGSPAPAPAPAPDSPAPGAVVLRPVPPSKLGHEDISVGQPFSFVGRSGRRVHGLFYPPTLGGTTGPPDALPPLIVVCHSGPTGAVGAGYDVVVQYFTSRGFALAAVDYAGSTGYGRAYRCSLWGQWGVADSEDCVDAARHLAAQGLVDGTRMAARGSSSGGLTALNALAAGEGFSAAASWYGVTDLLGLARSTHDFEAHYMDRLIGPLPGYEPVYEARSPVHRVADISGSVLLLQGLDDLVVPPAQTDDLCAALLARGRNCVVRRFEGEAHGFRRAETLRAALEEELAFYGRELELDLDPERTS